MYQVGDAVNTTEGPAIVHGIYSDGELELSFPDHTLPDELFTMAPEYVSPCTTHRRSLRKMSKSAVVEADVPRSNKRRRSEPHGSKIVDDHDHPRLAKHHRSSQKRPKIVVATARPIKRSSTEKEELVPRTNMYKKDRTPVASKSEQNTAFLVYICSLGIPMKKLSVLVLDTSMLRTTRMLLAAGLMPSHIYIPQPDEAEATRMLEQYPTLRVFAGLKAGDLIWKLADRGIKFHGALMDYCGMPGKIGRKNAPVDDMVNLFRYNLLQDHAVLTQTVCARSCVQTSRKYDGFKSLVKSIRNHTRLDGRRLYKAKELIYTDPGSQTMCHFRCMLQDKGGTK